jgi:hypothetical protein
LFQALLLVAVLVAATGCTPPADSPRTREAPRPDTAVAAAPGTSGFPFSDVTDDSGLAGFRHDNGATGRHLYVETMGPGLALFDVDGDRDLDLYVVDGGPLPPASAEGRGAGNRLYLNRGDGTFEDATAASGADDRGYGMGVAVGDYDGDADPDLYVLNYGPNALYRNEGGGRFSRVEAGVEDPSWSVSGAFFDADGDGDLDLYVANYLRYDVARETACRAGTLEIYCSPEQYPPAADRLYRNDGARFTEVSRQAGVAEDGRGMGVVAADLDADGDQDLYVANDRTRNFLYLNEGGRLREVGSEVGVAYSLDGAVEGGMGVVVADLIGAGPSIFLTNFQKEPNRLYVPGVDGFFDDLSLRSGLGLTSMEQISWGVAALDVEGDGDLDLAVANGHVFENAEAFIPGSSFAQPDQLFVNRGDGGFDARDFPPPHSSSRGLAAGDLDGDGDQDLVIASCGGGLRVWRNDAGSPDRFVVVRLVGRAPNTSAYGAVLTAIIDGRLVRREVASSGSYASHSDTGIHLGLGGVAAVTGLRVRWPDGTEEDGGEARAGDLLVWSQGKGIVAREPLGPT